jgi:DNA-binding transcriptional LysR family regulator
MKVPSLQLEAFYEVARLKHFTKAATSLHITQSALSQRILNLESGLGATLFVRERSGLRLTPAGEKLLGYCRVQNLQEGELLQEIKTGAATAGGWLRIAGFSSVIWSIAVPALADFVYENPNVKVDFRAAEMKELAGLLKSGEVDAILTAEKPEGPDWAVTPLGLEEYVMVSSAHRKPREGVYLDHDAEDPWTLDFLKRNGLATKNLRREYMDTVQGLMEGVAAGWGRAVLPKHLVKNNGALKIERHARTLKTPVLLVQPLMSHPVKLLEKVTGELKKNAVRSLGRI